eukprot:1161494-Pelagomonas_calceolata.AAC.6
MELCCCLEAQTYFVQGKNRAGQALKLLYANNCGVALEQHQGNANPCPIPGKSPKTLIAGAPCGQKEIQAPATTRRRHHARVTLGFLATFTFNT